MKLRSFKQALKKSIEQWSWKAQHPVEDYFEAKGIASDKVPACGCYLCQWRHEHQGDCCGSCMELKVWGKDKRCFDGRSVWFEYCLHPTKENVAKVQDALVRALRRLEKGS